jgi:DNA polymerase elongation subunit (family B)
MKILLLDIETAPNTAYVWGLFKENIPLVRLKESSYVLCWAAKWYGEKQTYFSSVYETSMKRMLKGIHDLLDEADAVVHFNGSSFDIPILNKEFVLHGFTPPAPYKQIDLLQVARKQFRFTSNKLDYIANRFNLGQKHNTTFELWVDCMNRDPKAWKKMEAYNRQDVHLLEKVYDKFKPWIKGHANHSLYSAQSLVCPNCGSDDFKKRGFSYTATAKYQRYQCGGCGNWFKGGRSLAPRVGEKFTNI